MTEKLLDLPASVYENMSENEKRACSILIHFLMQKPDDLRIVFDKKTGTIQFYKVVDL